MIGSIAAGAAAGKVSNAVLGAFIEDDAEEMVSIIESEFQDLAADYLINKDEADNIVEKLQKELNGKKLKDMFASSDRIEYADNLLIPIIESEIRKRKFVKVPTNKQMIDSLKEVLEEIADAS